MTDFAELGLSEDLLKAIADAGYTTPTPIQAQAIPYVLQGRDVLGCAQTGTGKTAGFTLPMIDILASGRARARMPRTLILEPTRELAAQVSLAFETYGKHHKLTMALVIGGESMSEQERKLDRGVDVLIATPGRLLDLYDRGKILLSDMRILVIDEADRMLDMGFIPDIERIVSLLPRIRQTLFFSATMPPEIRRLAEAFLSNPKEVTVAPPASPNISVAQHMVMLNDEDKREALRHLLRTEDVKNAIIFCNRKRDVDILLKSLQKHGFDAVALHGDMPQSKRTETLDKFRAGQARLLVASDVAARGIDIQGLSHVFNFDVPIHAEDYVHRIGRTGRAGNTGHAYMFATQDDGKFVGAIVKLIGKDIPIAELDGFEHPAFEEGDGRRGRGRRSGGDRSGGDRSGGDRSVRAKRTDRTPRSGSIDAVAAERPGDDRDAPDSAGLEATGDQRKRAPRARPERSRSDRSTAGHPTADRPAADRPTGRPSAEPATPIRMGSAGANASLGSDRGGSDRGGSDRWSTDRVGNDRGSNVMPFTRPHRRHEDDEDDARIIGFGDHEPAFVMRPVRFSTRS